MSTRLLYNDEQIVKAIKAGDRSVLAYMYERNWGVISQFIVKNSGTIEQAQDIYQEAIIACFQNIRKEGFELTSKLSTYIFAISKRLWYKELQKNSFVYTDTLISEYSDQLSKEERSQIEEREKQLDIMDQSLLKLGANCQKLIKDFYIEKKSMQEIALELGYTNADNAKNQKYKCMQRLKKAFFDMYSKNTQDEYSKL